MATRSLRWAVMAAVMAGAGCGSWLVAFNECDPDKGDVLGRTNVQLDVRRLLVRTAETPVGNMVADAMFDAASAGCAGGAHPCPVAAIENAGGIRSSTSCGEREVIPVGPLHEADITDMLPFATNQLVVVELTGEDLLLVLERSVSILGEVGEAGAAGFFLQVHGIAFDVDCGAQAQTLSAQNDRILIRGSRVDPARVTVGGQPLSLTATYPVAMNSFIASARDSFLGVALRNPDDSVITGADGRPQVRPQTFVQLDGKRLSDAEATMRYIRERDVVAPRVEGRIRLGAQCTPDG